MSSAADIDFSDDTNPGAEIDLHAWKAQHLLVMSGEESDDLDDDDFDDEFDDDFEEEDDDELDDDDSEPVLPAKDDDEEIDEEAEFEDE